MTVAPRTHWFAVFALFAAGLVASMQFAKLIPVLLLVGNELHLTLVQSALAVSLLGLVGIVFAVSAGAIASAVGLKRSVLLALAAGAVFAAMGAAAPTATLFLATRVLEGLAHLFIVVTAPALMSQHATAHDRPIVLSLWACFFGVGFSMVSAAAPAIVALGGWRGLMLAHAATMALVLGMAALALRQSGYHDSHGRLPRLGDIGRAHVALATTRGPLLLALTFCGYTILFLAMLTFMSLSLKTQQQWPAARADTFMSAVTLVALATTLASGFLVRHGVPFVAGVAVAFALIAAGTGALFFFPLGDAAVMAAIATAMAGFGLVPGFVLSSVPRVAPTPELASLTYGAIALFGNLGTFTGTPVFAALYEAGGWPAGGAAVLLACALGVALAFGAARHMSPETA